MHENRTSYALLLEDMGDLGTLSQTDSCPPEQALQVVRTLARMHAHWWESERLREWTWLPSTERRSEINTPLVQGGWDAFARRIAPRVDPAFVPVGERLVRDWGTLYERGAASGARTSLQSSTGRSPATGLGHGISRTSSHRGSNRSSGGPSATICSRSTTRRSWSTG